MLLLEEIFKTKKIQQSDEFNLRIHRGLSWLKQAFLLDHDPDLQFISLWISFNAIYAQDLGQSQDKQSLRQFLHLICQHDVDHRIYSILWDKFSQAIRMLLDNQYTYQGYWDYQNKKIGLEVCKAQLEQEKKKVFDKFYRSGSENTRKAQGTGLGLYLCKKIAETHNGYISVTDNQPNGSIFKVSFKS